ncbi:TonB-dependent receptor domain-containing protein [Phenylobacterium soli]|uniref:TonB-dependent receptor n=1 Tax=Phenylobacterium soli TaxID=2170551 RepID=A0A328AAM7_9CAUL|nr:TonB-dependent receptor [Phenylobacterium soli]RAK51803.1 TonB-dependent receptor [Phenylobacterium soli]
MTQSLNRRGAGLAVRLMSGAGVLALAALGASAAQAQTQAANAAAPSSTEVTEVVVTGTSLRGAPPVGAAVIAVGQEQIQKTGAQTVQQILRSVPAVVGLGSAGQGSFGSADAAGTNAPTIHGLGASASNSTLILIDGHRLPLSGVNHALADPNILPPMALERVEVLAEGASSVYGSDAVAGVINFITRRKFDGLEVRGQAAYGDAYDAYSFGAVAGKTWETGSVLAAYGYSDRSPLAASKRDFARADKRAFGGSNLGSFFCAPATIQVGSGPIFTAPYTGAGLANSAANAPCDYTGGIDLIPSEKRHSGMIKVTQEVSDKLTLTGDAVYSKRNNTTRVARGSIQATIFGPGAASASQINPFFVGLPGSTATSETVRFDADELLGEGAHVAASEESGYVSGSAEYKFNDNWRFTAGGVLGASNSSTDSVGVLCGSCALLALNGTTNGSGSLTAVSVPGTSIIVTQPLTTANALDVFHTGAANLTSAAVRRQLVDNYTLQAARQTIKDGTIKLDGTLFNLPAGPVKAAFGGEIIYYTMAQNVTQPLGIGPSSTGSRFLHLDYDRNVKSAYAEFLLPIISPEMEIPFARRVDVNVSGRYDKYSDFGSTSNPKVGANWEVIEGLKFRANWAKSFVAPALTSRGADANGTTAETSVSLFGGTLNVPVSAYPNVTQLPGCATATATCTVGGAIAGLQVNGGNAALQPQRGKSWSVGADWNPSFLRDLRLSVTYWHNEIQGAITAPQAAFAVNAAGLNSLLTIFPGGATPAQIAALTGGRPLTTTIPSNVYFIYNFQQRNALNLWVEGIDFAANYGISTDFGRFTLDAIASYKTKFDQQVGTGGATFSVLGTTGFNTTFPSIKLESRVGVDWASDFGLSANLYWNHTSPYHNWSGATVAPITRVNGVPVGGGDRVKAGNTIDAHVAYDFKGEGLTKDLQLFVDVTNLFDEDPPFYNNGIAAGGGSSGYDTFSGNPIGRLVAVGARKRW